MRVKRLHFLGFSVALCACSTPSQPLVSMGLSVAETPSQSRAADGQYISWKEHLIDTERVNGGVRLRGGDGLAAGDIDKDGIEDIISVHEDSNHLRIAFGSSNPRQWETVTLAEGADVGAIEDVAVGDLNGDGWLDLVAACEEAHLLYLENPGPAARSSAWTSIIPDVTRDRGSWLRAFIADVDQDGRMDVLAPNKGSADILDPATGRPIARSTSLFTLTGDPLSQDSWSEQGLSMEVVPNTAQPVDIDNDGDPDVLAAARIDQTISILENLGQKDGQVLTRKHRINIEPAFDVPEGWDATSSAFQSVFHDLDGDDRKDLIVAVYETVEHGGETYRLPKLGWLRQPKDLKDPWIYHPIGDTLPDLIIGIGLADIDGDGDVDAISGGYSGLNVLAGGYTGASREEDSVGVSAASSVGRIAWYENSGDPKNGWRRHDISRRVRGMYDGFLFRDLDQDGDLDIITTRGNSGDNDGLIWLEQVRTPQPVRTFTPARAEDSRALPLPPDNWIELYEDDVTFVAPNKRD